MVLDRRSTFPTDLPRIVAVCLETIRTTSGRRSIFVAPRQGSPAELCSGKLLGMKKAPVSMLALLGIHQHLSAEQRLADAPPQLSSSTPEPSEKYSDSAASGTRSWQSELMATQLMQQGAAQPGQ